MAKKKKQPKQKPTPLVPCPTPGCVSSWDELTVALTLASVLNEEYVTGVEQPPLLLLCSRCRNPSTVVLPLPPGGKISARHLTPNERFRAEVEAPDLLNPDGLAGGDIAVQHYYPGG